MISLWPTIARSLNASEATKHLAASLQLQRVTDSVFWFDSKEAVTMTATRKLADAVAQHAGQALTVVIKHVKTGAMQRCYSDRSKP